MTGKRVEASINDPVGVQRDTIESAAFLFCAALLLWLVGRPYEGIYHDSVIYSLLSAKYLNPEAYARDLFFIFGSQDDFSVYTPMFSQLVSWVGLDLASRMVVLAGGVGWQLAMIWLGWEVFRGAFPWKLLVLVAAALTWSYSPNLYTFQLGENFATPRVIAMPLSLMALAAEIRGWRLFGLGLALLATALHPLMGLWGLGLQLGYRWKQVFQVGAVFALCLALYVGPSYFPFGRLQLMNEAWAETVRHSAADVFMAGWGELHLERLIYSLSALWLGARLGTVRLRPLYLTLGLMTASLYFIALVCSLYFPVILILQTQLWRILWLAMILGLVALLDAAWHLVSRNSLYWGVGAVFGMTLYALESHTIYVAPLMVSVLVSSRGNKWLLRIAQAPRERPYMAMIGLVAYGAMLLPRYLLDLEILGNAIMPPWWQSAETVRGFLLGGGLGLGSMAIAAFWSLKPARIVIWLALCPSLVAALWFWDGRQQVHKNLEAQYLDPPVRPFAGKISRGDVVAWPETSSVTRPNREMDVWFLLGAANYAGRIQATGMVFSEAKTWEVKRRLERLAVASMPGGESDTALALARYKEALITGGLEVENVREYQPVSTTPGGVPYLCQDGELDWVIVSSSIGNAVPLRPVSEENISGKVWALFKC